MSEQFDQNPYAAGTAIPATVESTHAEEVRRMYLSHEASVKSIASVLLIGGIIGLLLSLMYIVAAISASIGPNMRPAMGVLMIIGTLLGAISIANLWTAIGLRKLSSRSRLPATILSALGLLFFPVGTIIGAYSLYLLLSSKASMVFSEDYKEIIRQTPHIRYKTSVIVWVFGLLVLAFLLLGIGAAIFART